MSEHHHHTHHCKPIMHYHEHYWREREEPLTHEMPCAVPVSGSCFMTPRGPICVTSPRMHYDGWRHCDD
jgi:hypothetical protein